MITSGPLRELKLGVLSLDPVDDSPAEYELNGTDFETKRTTTGKNYSEGKEKVGFIKQECVFSSEKYEDYMDLKDGVERSGNATLPDGTVLNLNVVIEGAQELVGGKLTVYLAGGVEFA